MWTDEQPGVGDEVWDGADPSADERKAGPHALLDGERSGLPYARHREEPFGSAERRSRDDPESVPRPVDRFARDDGQCLRPHFVHGINLGKGLATKDIHDKTGLAEGAFTAPVLLEMARDKQIDMPIASAVAAMLSGQMSVDEAIESLLARPLRTEE